MAGFRPGSVHLRVAALAAIGAGCVLLPQPSSSQEIDEEAADETIEEIVVIGSRLRRRDYTSPT